ncbi:hypothetical protein UFOVP2_38 [uncultured Caudovirales phage]|uniref:Uncharacterized protein n=1 Tax=uncultured Caudovirales phage TaxID=2100421 RepID=A0A6J5KFZ2_9CAUD|nr:hypothetical protein UFOVP2_38 [uncultured Caudovirales phage]
MIAFPGNTFPAPSGAGPAQYVVYNGGGVSVPQNFLGSTFTAPQVIRGLTDGYTQYVGSVSTATSFITMLNYDPRPDIWDSVTISSTGSLPTPLQAGVTYYPVNAVKGIPTTVLPILQLSATPSGNPIILSTSGTGTISFNAFVTDLGLSPCISRGLDSGMPSWNIVNTSNGVYDWTKMDNYVNYHFTSRGRQSILTLNCTPSWAAVNQALDAYGNPGGGQVPTSLALPATYCAAVWTRYNAGASKPFVGVEMWNEPSFAAPGTTGQNFCGTVSQLSQITRLVNQSVKAIDSSALILSPGFTNGSAQVAPSSASTTTLYAYLNASDGAAGTAKQWIDGVCYHGYDTSPGNLVQLPAVNALLKSVLVGSGLSSSFPLYQTERGVNLGNPSAFFLQCAAIEAALGIKMSILYNNDSYGINPRFDSSLRAKMNIFYSSICGKTITYCAINQDGSVTTIANGVTQTW